VTQEVSKIVTVEHHSHPIYCPTSASTEPHSNIKAKIKYFLCETPGWKTCMFFLRVAASGLIWKGASCKQIKISVLILTSITLNKCPVCCQKGCGGVIPPTDKVSLTILPAITISYYLLGAFANFRHKM